MAQTNLIGKNILGYTVSEKLGSGAFGTVYKVIKTNAAGQYVRALKHITIPTEKQYISVLNSMGGNISKTDSYFSEMLNNIVSEIRILNELSEKGVQHIVRYYENDILVTDSPRCYDIFILMEYLTPLEDFIQNNDFCVCDVVNLGLDILSGLRSCHSNGIIHRDIKDDNIFVSNKGEYKIGDFGVSKMLKDSSKAESLKGTPNFLAPEVYLGKEGYTKSVDLYSLGIVLYRLLNYNRNPFLPHFPEQFYSYDENIAFEKRMNGETPTLPSLGGEHIGRAIVKAISNSAERYKTADDFISSLEWAVRYTSDYILNEKIKFNTALCGESSSNANSIEYNVTLGETYPSLMPEECANGEYDTSINKHLFDSIGETNATEFSEIEADGMHLSENTSANTKAKAENRILPSVSASKAQASLDKKKICKFIFWGLCLILLIGLSVFIISKIQQTTDNYKVNENIVHQTSEKEEADEGQEDVENVKVDGEEILRTIRDVDLDGDGITYGEYITVSSILIDGIYYIRVTITLSDDEIGSIIFPSSNPVWCDYVEVAVGRFEFENKDSIVLQCVNASSNYEATNYHVLNVERQQNKVIILEDSRINNAFDDLGFRDRMDMQRVPEREVISYIDELGVYAIKVRDPRSSNERREDYEAYVYWDGRSWNTYGEIINEAYTSEEIVQMVIEYRARHNLYECQMVEIEQEDQEYIGSVLIHCYDVINEDLVTGERNIVTHERYIIYKSTAYGTDSKGNHVDLLD